MSACTNCGSHISTDAAFCGACGRPVEAVAPPPTVQESSAPPPLLDGQAPTPALSADRTAAPSIKEGQHPYYLKPPPGFTGTATVAVGEQTVNSSGFQSAIAGVGTKIGDFFANPKSKPTAADNLIPRMVKAIFLDAEIYRAVWKEEKLTVESCVIATIGFLCAAGAGVLFSGLFGDLGLMPILLLLIGQLVALAAFVLVATLASQGILGKKAEPKAVLRVVGYAQSAGLLGLIPYIGTWLALWRIVTTVVAIRAGFGADWGKSVLLTVIAAAGAVVSSFVVVRIIAPLFF